VNICEEGRAVGERVRGGRKRRERESVGKGEGWKALLGYSSRAAEFLVTPLAVATNQLLNAVGRCNTAGARWRP